MPVTDVRSGYIRLPLMLPMLDPLWLLIGECRPELLQEEKDARSKNGSTQSRRDGSGA